jgi:mannose/fructose/N-acetylgalactosamine-specific phosphotransferase system component IID
MLRMFLMVFCLSFINLTVTPLIMGDGYAYSQPKNSAPNLNQIETQSTQLVTVIWNVAKLVIGLVLLISLIFVVWMLSQNHPKAKEALIGWIVAVGVYAIGLAIL